MDDVFERCERFADLDHGSSLHYFHSQCKQSKSASASTREEFLYDLLRNPKSYNTPMPQQKKATFPENVSLILEKLGDSTVVIACSGGPDSMVILDLVRKYQKPKTKNQKQDNDNRIIVAHVHH